MRFLDKSEKPLLAYLLGAANLRLNLNTLKVEEMSDGGMGSLNFLNPGLESSNNQIISECYFLDSDDILVQATLYANSEGNPCEMGVWKVDFSPLQHQPQISELSYVPIKP